MAVPRRIAGASCYAAGAFSEEQAPAALQLPRGLLAAAYQGRARPQVHRSAPPRVALRKLGQHLRRLRSSTCSWKAECAVPNERVPRPGLFGAQKLSTRVGRLIAPPRGLAFSRVAERSGRLA